MYQSAQSFELIGPGELHVAQTKGRVRIQGGPGTRIAVTAASASEEALAERLDVFQQGNAVHVRIRPHWGLFQIFSGPMAPIDLAITVPEQSTCVVETGSGDTEVAGTLGSVRLEAGSGGVRVSDATSVDVETGSGSVDIRRVQGSIRLETGSGAVRVEESGGDVEVEVGSGDVTAGAIAGDLRIETGSGDLTVADVVGSVDLETGSGTVRADRIRGASVSAETGGGNIELSGLDVARLDLESSSGNVMLELATVQLGGEYTLETSSGTIRVVVPADAGVDFKVNTSSGAIRYDLPLQVQHAERGELEAILNGGGARVSIEAGSGNVNLIPLQRPHQAPAAPAAPAALARPEPATQPGAEPEAEPSATPIMDAIRADATLAGNEYLKRVLDMVKAGKLSPAQAEEILQALDEEDTEA